MNMGLLKNKIILAPDSFKGTMSSIEVCQIMEKAILEINPDANVISIPIADGGEGTVEAFIKAVGGHKIEKQVTGPLKKIINSFYGYLSPEVAIVEMAAAAGLTLLEGNLNVLDSTTFGVGELILSALESGHSEILVGLGGSATNDGGCGACAALGVKFLNVNNEEFIPVGKTLMDINRIDVSHLNPLVKKAKIRLMSDIDNPLCGVSGAVHVFGPQKGTNEYSEKLLNQGLLNLSKILKRDVGVDILDMPGSGAAGGMGGGLHAMLNANLEMGIDLLLDIVGFDDELNKSCLVFSGEGQFDNQTLRGKAITGIAKRTQEKQVPLIVVVGDIVEGVDEAYRLGISAITSINRVAIPYSQAKLRSKKDLEFTTKTIMRILNLGGKLFSNRMEKQE